MHVWRVTHPIDILRALDTQHCPGGTSPCALIESTFDDDLAIIQLNLWRSSTQPHDFRS
jgi:hypothetical protein